MQPVFKDVERETSAGAPRVEIPPALAGWLEKTYADRKMCVLPCEHGDDADELIRLCRLYAYRQGRTIQHRKTWDKDGRELVEFRMKDKRPYHRQEQT